LYGELQHLSTPNDWTQGVANILERIVWEPSLVLGVSKAEYVRQIVNECILELGTDHRTYSLLRHEKIVKTVGKKITKKLERESKKYRKWERCAKNEKGELIIDSSEAIRRARFRSEEYLNAEFDIFFSLVPNAYLDQLYSTYCTSSKVFGLQAA